MRRALLAAGASVAAAAAATGSGLAANALRAAVLPPDGLAFERKYIGELTPPMPGVLAASESRSVERDGIVWQRGPYNSWWLRLAADAGADSIRDAVDGALEAAASAASAVYVSFPERRVSAYPLLSELLHERGFSFHHYQPAGSPPLADAEKDGGGQFIYYRWCGDPEHDMVPSYATSIEGVGGLLLSPDESKVLLIWEYENWKVPSGAVDPAESKITALRRELREEVSAELDDGFLPVYLGGWQIARARDKLVNDNFSAFVVRAKSEAFAVDGNEVVDARWFDCADLVARWKAEGAPVHRERRSLGLAGGERSAVSTLTLAWLDAYASGGGLRCKLLGDDGADGVSIGTDRAGR